MSHISKGIVVILERLKRPQYLDQVSTSHTISQFFDESRILVAFGCLTLVHVGPVKRKRSYIYGTTSKEVLYKFLFFCAALMATRWQCSHIHKSSIMHSSSFTVHLKDISHFLHLLVNIMLLLLPKKTVPKIFKTSLTFLSYMKCPGAPIITGEVKFCGIPTVKE